MGQAYMNMTQDEWICVGSGAKAGQGFINGDDYLNVSFEYYDSHKWRNFGIVIAFTGFSLGTYLLVVYLNPGLRSKGELLVFQRSMLKMSKQ
jgi:ATP-binding cassette subfamily G (WHITE) protein 2 (PDR)